jgi:hypothetical protein
MPETQVVQDAGDVAPKTTSEPDLNAEKLITIGHTSKLMGATFVMTLSFADWLFNTGQSQGEKFEKRFPSPIDFFQMMAPWIAESVATDKQPLHVFQERFNALIAELDKD